MALDIPKLFYEDILSLRNSGFVLQLRLEVMNLIPPKSESGFCDDFVCQVHPGIIS